MRYLLISEFFYPDNKSATSKVLTELVEDMADNGMDIKVLTSRHLYASNNKIENDKDVHKGILIDRVWSTNYNKDKVILRIINSITFFISIFIKLISSDEYDCMIFVSNPPIMPYIGHILKKFRKKSYIYLIHDVYPDIAIKLNVIKPKGIISGIMNYTNFKALDSADKVLVLGEDMKSVIVNKNVSPDRIIVLSNWADKTKLFFIGKNNGFSIKNGINNTFNIVYSGNMGRFHDIETIIKAAIELNKVKDDICFIFVGGGFKRNDIKEAKENYNLDNVYLMEYLNDNDYNLLLNSADVFVTSIEKDVIGLCVPSKTYSYLALGKPIIAVMSKESEIGKMVDENNLGVRVDNGDVKSLVDFIINIKNDNDLRKKISDNVISLFDNMYERKIVTKKYINAINDGYSVK
jgi:glycosyltransferase involved in cell wall biosynthesis